MSKKKKLLRGGSHVLLGEGVGLAFNFMRNFIVARLVSPEDFGIATTFAISLSLLEMASDFSLDKLIIQASDGDDLRLQAVAQFILVIRGIFIALMIFLVADWIAAFFNVPEAAWAYRMLSIVPLIDGFLHLDIKRFQREFVYKWDVNIKLLSQFAALIIAVGLALQLNDYRAMLWSVIGQVTVLTLGSHLVATRQYKIEWSSEYFRRILTFAWPLMINGLVIFAGGQGDRLLVGGNLGVSELAPYAAASLLIVSFVAVAMKVTNALVLPLLAEVQGDSKEFITRYRLVSSAIGIAAIMLFVPMIFIGAEIVVIIFGGAYRGPFGLVAWISLGVGIRFLRLSPTLASLSVGDTKNLMFVNITRMSGLIIAFFALKMGGGLVHVAIAMAIGEIISTVVGYIRLNYIVKVPIEVGYGMAGFVLSLFLVSLIIFIQNVELSILLKIFSSIIMICIGVGLFIMFFKDSRTLYTRLYKRAKDI